MKPRWIVPLATAIAGSLFFGRKARHTAGSAAWGGAAGPSFTGFRSQMRPHAYSGLRHRRRGLLSRIFGFFWGLFWICFGLSFAFGGGEFRNAFIGFFSSFGQNMARFFTGLFSSAGGLMQ
jgi:hypothetical protein